LITTLFPAQITTVASIAASAISPLRREVLDVESDISV